MGGACITHGRDEKCKKKEKLVGKHGREETTRETYV
jgi:hypothetical protein